MYEGKTIFVTDEKGLSGIKLGGTRKSFARKSRVNAPTVSISPSTLALMEENERIIEKYGNQRKRFSKRFWEAK